MNLLLYPKALFLWNKLHKRRILTYFAVTFLHKSNNYAQ